MGTDDVFTRKDKKLGTGISDDFYMEHNGTDSKLVNSTGNTYIQTTTATKKTIIDNGVSDNQLVVDHDNSHIGMGTAAPLFQLEICSIDSNASMVVANPGGVQAKMTVGTAGGQVGSRSNHQLKIVTNNLSRIEVATNGDTKILAAYSTLIGGTNVDLYIDNTGLVGPLPSFIDSKENIRDLTDNDTSWIHNIPVKMCDYKDGTKDQITVIAEDAEAIHPNAIRYTPFEITENGSVMLNRSEHKNLEEIGKLIVPGEEKEIELDKVAIDENGEETIEKITKRVKLQPFTTNKSDFIYPMLKEMQKMKLTIDNLKARIIELEK